MCYEPGDAVCFWTPGCASVRSEKRLQRYFDPYKVGSCLSDVPFKFIPDGTATSSLRNTTFEVVHVVRMKPYHERNWPLSNTTRSRNVLCPKNIVFTLTTNTLQLPLEQIASSPSGCHPPLRVQPWIKRCSQTKEQCHSPCIR